MHEAARAIREDATAGATELSMRALDALFTATETADDTATVREVARDLRAARPAMVVVANRVDRAMATADSHAPADVAAATERVIAAAREADRTAARDAADRLGDRVLTLSRSGTVVETLQNARPDRVFVAESRPAREGVDVAEELSHSLDVTLHTDAAVADVLAERDVDTLLTGADTVAPDGRVLNKTGTRTASLAAAHEGCPHLAVAARDKVAPDGLEREDGDPTAVYDGDADLSVHAPTFDVTPADHVTVVTEDGPHDPDDVAVLAEEHRANAAWVDRDDRQ